MVSLMTSEPSPPPHTNSLRLSERRFPCQNAVAGIEMTPWTDTRNNLG